MVLSHRQLIERGENPIHRDVHIPEFRAIVIEELEKRDNELIRAFEHIIDDAAESIIGAVRTDVRTIVKMSFKDAKDIFESEKAQEYVSRAIVNVFKDELHKPLKNIDIS